MGNEKKGLQRRNTVSFGMNKYFAESVLPDKIRSRRKNIVKNTPTIQNENELMLLVCGGSGRIIVNHEIYRLKRGVLICLGPFHSYTIKPDNGSNVEYMEAHMNSGAYLYIMSCPYLKVKEMSVPQKAAVVQLTADETEAAESVMNGLCDTDGVEGYYEDKKRFFNMVWLFGILLARIYKDKKKNKKE